MRQGDEIGEKTCCGGLDVPSFTERRNGCAVDDGDDHLRLKRAVELTQYPTQGGVEALTSLAVGLLDRGRLAG